MAEEPTYTQETQPETGEPVVIPVPAKDQIMGDLEKIAAPPDEDSD